MKQCEVELTLPKDCTSVEAMVESWGLKPCKAEDLPNGRARLIYGYGGYFTLDCIKEAAMKTWGKTCLVGILDEAIEYEVKYISHDASDGIVRAFERFCYINDRGNAKRRVEKFAAKWNLPCRGGFIFRDNEAISGGGETEDSTPCRGSFLQPKTFEAVVSENDDNSLNVYIDNIEGGRNHHFSDVQTNSDEVNSKKHLLQEQPPTQEGGLDQSDRRGDQHYDWDEMISNCQLAALFESGEFYGHDITWSLMTNYISIEGGQARFLRCLASRDGYDEQLKDDWLYQILRSRKLCHRPTWCEKYCPYIDRCNRCGKNILHQVLRPGQVRSLSVSSRKEIAMETAEELTSIFVKEALTEKDDPNTIYVLKVPTGVGKTTNILDIQDAVVAYPNHDLADEIADKMTKAGNKVIRVGRLPITYDSEFLTKIEHLHKVGAHYRAAAMVADEVNKLKQKAKKLTKAEESLIQYANSLGWLYNGNKMTAVITHKRALHMRRDQVRSVVVFDEDPLCESINQSSASMSDLIVLKNAALEKADAKVAQSLVQIIRGIENADNGVYVQTPIVESSQSNEVVDFVLEHTKKLDSNVLGLLQADWFVKVGNKAEMVHYASRPKLPEGRVVVLSATADEHIYRLAFPDRRIVFREIGPVKSVGVLRQCLDETFSKQMITRLKKDDPEKLEAFLAAIKQEVGNQPVLTYKSLEDDAKAAGLNVFDPLHYGKVVGSNLLEDESICVLGTYALNPVAYKLLALCLDIRFSLDDQQMRYQRVQHNGYEFYMVAFDNPRLRAIQIWRMESELMQAVGRARHLRKPNTVTVFASFPLEGAEIFKLKMAA